MSDFLQTFDRPWLIALAFIALILCGWLIYRYVRRFGGGLQHAIASVSFDKVEGLVIPSADEGEILIDFLLLTSKGLLVLEVKDVTGTVFGGDKLRDWSVIADDGRYTFSNPQPALYDRVAAVRQIVREVPVSGRILFLDGAEFPKGVPDMVTSVAGVIDEFGELDKSAAKFKIEAFKPHWEKIRKEALDSAT